MSLATKLLWWAAWMWAKLWAATKKKLQPGKAYRIWKWVWKGAAAAWKLMKKAASCQACAGK